MNKMTRCIGAPMFCSALVALLALYGLSLQAASVLSPGEIAFVGINTDGSPDRFAFVALADIDEGTEIYFTDEGWDGTDFRGTSEDTGYWTAPAGGVAAGSVIEVEGAAVIGGGGWSGESLDALNDSNGDQILAYQVYPAATNFLAGIGAGSGSGNWISAGTPDASESYVPAPLALGTNVLGFTSDSGYYNSLPANTGTGLRRLINDDGTWLLSSTPVWPASWSITVNDELSPGDIAFVQINVDNTDNFGFVTLVELGSSHAISFSDKGWTNSAGGGSFVTSGAFEDTGTWIGPAGGVAPGTVVIIEGSTVVSGGGVWTNDPLDSLTDSDQVLAFQGVEAEPSFIAGIGSGTGGDLPGGWLTSGACDNSHSYLPDTLELGISANGFLSDNGAYTGPTTNIASGLVRYINDGDTDWDTDSTDNKTFAGTFRVNPELDAGDVAFVQINTGNPDSFGFVSLVDLEGFLAIQFTDSSWTNDGSGGVFATTEDFGTWTVPGGGLNAGTVVVISNGVITSGSGSWSGDSFTTLTDSGDQLFAFQGHPDLPHFLAGISVGQTTYWLSSGAPDSQDSYLPDTLGLGTNALGFTSDNGAYIGPMADIETGLRYAINDPANWDTDSGLAKTFSGTISILDPLFPGGIVFVGYNADGSDGFAFLVIDDIPGYSRISFTDQGWSNDTFVSSEDVGTWVAPAGGLLGGNVVTVQGSTVTPGGSGTWEGNAIDPISTTRDTLLAFQSAEVAPKFVAGLSTDGWLTNGVPGTTESYLPAELVPGFSAVTFDGEDDNGYYNTGKESGSRWGQLTAINSQSSWTRSESALVNPSWSFSPYSATPILAPGDIAFVAYSTDENRFAFVALTSLSAGTEIAFTDIGWDTLFLITYAGVGVHQLTPEDTIVWTAPVGGISAGTVVEIDGTTVTGGGTVSGAMGELRVTGDQILAFQNGLYDPMFLAGISSRDWSGPVLGDHNRSLLPDDLMLATHAPDFPATDVDNGYYSGTTSGDAATLLSLINGEANWTRDDDEQIWPASWSFTVTTPAPLGTLFKFR